MKRYNAIKGFRDTFSKLEHSTAITLKVGRDVVVALHLCRDVVVFEAVKTIGYDNIAGLKKHLAACTGKNEDEKSRVLNSYFKLAAAFPTSMPKSRRRPRIRKHKRCDNANPSVDAANEFESL